MGLGCAKPMGKFPEQTNRLQAMASSRLVNEPTYNGADVFPAMIDSSGIDMGLQPMAPYYSHGKLSLADNPRARQSQQDTAYDNDHAKNSGNLTFRSHIYSQVLMLNNRTLECL